MNGQNTYYRGKKQYELSNHLGNVLVTVSDRKRPVDTLFTYSRSAGTYKFEKGYYTNVSGCDSFNSNTTTAIADFYNADVITAQDYYPFGSPMSGRRFNSREYRFGFQGQEKDDEMKGEGNSISFTYRMQDTRIGRFFSIDPLSSKYPFYTPYSFSGNKLIAYIELEGLEELFAFPCKGNGKNYTPSHIQHFYKAASLANEKFGYSLFQINNGQQLLKSLQGCLMCPSTPIKKIITYSHAGIEGLFLDIDEGFYNNMGYGGQNQAFVSDLKDLVNDGKLSFDKNSIWVFMGCETFRRGTWNSIHAPNIPIAEDVSKSLGIMTIGSTGKTGVDPNRGNLGFLKTDGEFLLSITEKIQKNGFSYKQTTIYSLGSEIDLEKWLNPNLLLDDVKKMMLLKVPVSTEKHDFKYTLYDTEKKE